MTAVQMEFQKLQEALFEQGIEQGIEQGLRESVGEICQVLDIPLTPARQRQLDALDAVGLRDLLVHLRRERRWPSRGRGRAR